MSGGGVNSSTDEAGAESDTSYSVSESASIQSIYDYRTPAPEPWPVDEPLVVPAGKKRVTTFLRGSHAGLVMTDYPEGSLGHLLESAPVAITVAPVEEPDAPLGMRAVGDRTMPANPTGMQRLQMYLCGTGSETASGKHELIL
jgi:hypothetical protein